MFKGKIFAMETSSDINDVSGTISIDVKVEDITQWKKLFNEEIEIDILTKIENYQ